jgi:hypothetical protein
LADTLFTRSKAFRGALCASFPEFLAGAAPGAAPGGGRAPAPPAAAASLDAAARATVVAWDASFGHAYPEVRAGAAFLA